MNGKETAQKSGTELHYHGRGLSVKGLAEGKKRRKRSFFAVFRSNPSLSIVLVDIIVIVLVLLMIIPFVRKKSEVRDFMGYELSLHGFVYEGSATVSLVCTALPGERIEQNAESAGVKIRFIVENEEAVEKEEVLEAKLPKIGETTVLRSELSLDEGEKAERLRAVLTIGGKELSLQKSLSTEK